MPRRQGDRWKSGAGHAQRVAAADCATVADVKLHTAARHTPQHSSAACAVENRPPARRFATAARFFPLVTFTCSATKSYGPCPSILPPARMAPPPRRPPRRQSQHGISHSVSSGCGEWAADTAPQQGADSMLRRGTDTPLDPSRSACTIPLAPRALTGRRNLPRHAP